MQVVSISSVKKSWIDLHEKLKLLATLKRLTKKNTKTEMCKKTSQNLSITERNSIKCLCTSSNLIMWLSRDTLVVAV